MRRSLSSWVRGCGALALGLILLSGRESSAQYRPNLRGGSLTPQTPVPLRPPGSSMNQPDWAADGLLNPFSPQGGGFVTFNTGGQSGGSSSFASGASPYGNASPYGAVSPYGGYSPYGSYNPFGASNPYGGYSPYGAFSPYGAYNPYGTFNPYAAYNPYTGMNPYAAFNMWGGVNPMAPFNAPAAPGINPAMGFNPFGF